MEIKKYNNGDEIELRRFLSNYSYPHMHNETKHMEKEREEIISLLKNCFIGKSGGKIVGVIDFGKQDFDTEVLGVNSGVISLLYSQEMAKELLEKAVMWFKDEKVNFVTLRVDSKDNYILNESKTIGFNPVEILYTFKIDFRDKKDILLPKTLIRSFRREDVEQIENISENAFNFDRFNQDYHLNLEKSKLHKKLWARNCCNGRSLDVLVAEVDGEVAGFVTCCIKDNVGRIELIAVAEKYRGRNIGVDLLYAAQKWFAERCEVMFVGTQAINVPAVKMYLKTGFKIESASITLHGWF